MIIKKKNLKSMYIKIFNFQILHIKNMPNTTKAFKYIYSKIHQYTAIYDVYIIIY